jgi:hypothetical protein
MFTRLLLAASVVAFAAPAMAAKQIVVRSSGPSAKVYPVGKQLEAGARVSLRAGDSLTVLGAAKARVLQGPGSFKIAAGGDTDAFSRSRFSARRGPPLPRGPWALDVEQSGQVCAAAKQPISLWRSVAEQETTVTITGAKGKPVTLNWPAGSESLSWPSALPLEEGRTYRVELEGRSAPTEWKIVSLGALAMDRAATADALLKRRCQAQFDLLVERALWDSP